MNKYALILPNYLNNYIDINNIFLLLKTYHPSTAILHLDQNNYEYVCIKIPNIFKTDNGIYIRLICNTQDIYNSINGITFKSCIDLLNGLVWDFGFPLTNGYYIKTNGDIKKCSLYEMEKAYLLYNL
jgi:hypothetical protein